MEDGVLSLKIYCGKPFELDDEETIVIRWNKFREENNKQTTSNSFNLFFFKLADYRLPRSALSFRFWQAHFVLRCLRCDVDQWSVLCSFFSFKSSWRSPPCFYKFSSRFPRFFQAQDLKVSSNSILPPSRPFKLQGLINLFIILSLKSTPTIAFVLYFAGI